MKTHEYWSHLYHNKCAEDIFTGKEIIVSFKYKKIIINKVELEICVKQFSIKAKNEVNWK